MKILCLFGENQYGNIVRGESTESFSFMPALQALGHEVRIFDSWDKSAYSNYAELNVALVDRCKQDTPDVILWVALNVEIWIETLDFLRHALGIRVIHWAPDDSWKFRQHSCFIARHVDLCVTTYPEFLKQYRSLGARAFVSGWGIPEAWRGNVVPSANCAYDVTFVGTAQPARARMIKALERSGVRIQCFGYGWPAGPIPSDRIPEIFRQSRISLNFANSSGANQVKARVFEVTGAGGFLLTESAPGLDRIFELDREVAAFVSVDECEQMVRYYLANPTQRDLIARAGNARTQREYSYVVRLRKVLAALPAGPGLLATVHGGFEEVAARHTHPKILRWLAAFLTFFGVCIFGQQRGPRFARRLCFEVSWRMAGESTFAAAGLVGRMFYV